MASATSPPQRSILAVPSRAAGPPLSGQSPSAVDEEVRAVEGSAGSVMSTARDGGARVLVRGRLDAAATGRLRGLLEDVPAAGAAVTVDLSRADTLPFGVLAALADAHRRLTDGGGGLVLVHPSAAAERSLRISGLHRALRVDRRSVTRPPVRWAADA